MGKMLAAPTFLAAVGCGLIILGTSTRVWMTTTVPEPSIYTNNTLDHFGLFQACYVINPQGDMACAGVNYWCDAQVCWWVNLFQAVCASYNVWAIDNCSAYQAARSFAVMALTFATFGAFSLGAGSGFLDSMRFGRSGGLMSIVGGLFGMISMAVWVGSIYKGTGSNGLSVEDNFKLDWSFGCFTAGWVLCFVAGLMGLAIASRLGKQVNVATEMADPNC